MTEQGIAEVGEGVMEEQDRCGRDVGRKRRWESVEERNRIYVEGMERGPGEMGDGSEEEENLREDMVRGERSRRAERGLETGIGEMGETEEGIE